MQSTSRSDFEEELKAWLADARKVAVVSVGNTMRRDDAVGIEIVRALQGKVSSKVSLVEAETTPENYIGQITDFHPSHVLVIDSGLIDEKPGGVKLLVPTENMEAPISTHLLPLQLFCVYLERWIGAKVLTLLVQPKDTGMGEGLTKETAETAEEIADFLAKILP
jgi:hydrogenase 3 maturation protease